MPSLSPHIRDSLGDAGCWSLEQAPQYDRIFFSVSIAVKEQEAMRERERENVDNFPSPASVGQTESCRLDTYILVKLCGLPSWASLGQQLFSCSSLAFRPVSSPLFQAGCIGP